MSETPAPDAPRTAGLPDFDQMVLAGELDMLTRIAAEVGLGSDSDGLTELFETDTHSLSRGQLSRLANLADSPGLPQAAAWCTAEREKLPEQPSMLARLRATLGKHRPAHRTAVR